MYEFLKMEKKQVLLEITYLNSEHEEVCVECDSKKVLIRLDDEFLRISYDDLENVYNIINQYKGLL